MKIAVDGPTRSSFFSTHRAIAERVIDTDRRRVTVVRLRTATAPGGERLTAVIRRAGAIWSPEQTAMSNRIAVNSLLEPGWPVKLPIRETVLGSSA